MAPPESMLQFFEAATCEATRRLMVCSTICLAAARRANMLRSTRWLRAVERVVNSRRAVKAMQL